MNILWLDTSIPASTMSSWIVREGKKSVFRVIPYGNPHLLYTQLLTSERNVPDNMIKHS